MTIVRNKEILFMPLRAFTSSLSLEAMGLYAVIEAYMQKHDLHQIDTGVFSTICKEPKEKIEKLISELADKGLFAVT